VTDRPHLVGWGSLHRARHRSPTSFVVIAGTASPVPGPAGSWLDSHLAMHAECSPARPRLPIHLALRLDIVTIGTPSVVSRSTGLPRPPNPRALSCLIAPRSFAHRSRLGAAASCVSTLVRRAPRPAPCRRLALRLLVRHDARCVRPTSAFSRSSYEHPRLVGSRCVMRLRECAIEEIACFTSVRFASVGHTFVVLSPRWALSSRRDACDPYLWHPCRLSHRCHVARATCAPVEAAETALDSIA